MLINSDFEYPIPGFNDTNRALNYFDFNLRDLSNCVRNIIVDKTTGNL